MTFIMEKNVLSSTKSKTLALKLHQPTNLSINQVFMTIINMIILKNCIAPNTSFSCFQLLDVFFLVVPIFPTIIYAVLRAISTVDNTV